MLVANSSSTKPVTTWNKYIIFSQQTTRLLVDSWSVLFLWCTSQVGGCLKRYTGKARKKETVPPGFFCKTKFAEFYLHKSTYFMRYITKHVLLTLK